MFADQLGCVRKCKIVLFNARRKAVKHAKKLDHPRLWGLCNECDRVTMPVKQAAAQHTTKK